MNDTVIVVQGPSNNVNEIKNSLIGTNVIFSTWDYEKSKYTKADNVVFSVLENKPYIDKQSNDDYLLKLSRENKEIKDNLQMIVKTFNNFTKEANDKFLDYEAAFVDIENKLKAFIEENTEEEPFEGELMENDHELSTDDVSSTILSEEIKNEIRNI